MMIDRPYQQRAVGQVLDYAADHPTGSVLLVIPTRGGKTLVGAKLVLRMAVRHGLRTLWIAHREELLDAAVEHLIEVGIHPASIGMIKSRRSSDPDAKVQVASDPTLDRRTLPVAHLVITDECQLDTAPRRRRIRNAYPNAFMLGLSGTPKPPPQRDLSEDYDTLMVVVQPSELIHDGHISVPTLYAPEESATPDLRSLRVVKGDYQPQDLEPLLLRPSLLDEQIKEWARLSEGRKTVAYPATVVHSKALAARFQALGVNARHLDGTTSRTERKDILTGVKSGPIEVVCSVDVLSQGTNLPEVKCVLGVRPTQSLTLYIQQSMRCATPWHDVRPRILDVVGNVYRHALPFEDRHWSLKNSQSGIPVRGNAVVKRCPFCGAMMFGGLRVCPSPTCERVLPLPEPIVPDVSLDLRQFDPGKAKLQAERGRLLAFAEERGFKDPNGWVDRVLVAKFGEATAA